MGRACSSRTESDGGLQNRPARDRQPKKMKRVSHHLQVRFIHEFNLGLVEGGATKTISTIPHDIFHRSKRTVWQESHRGGFSSRSASAERYERFGWRWTSLANCNLKHPERAGPAIVRLVVRCHVQQWTHTAGVYARHLCPLIASSVRCPRADLTCLLFRYDITIHIHIHHRTRSRCRSRRPSMTVRGIEEPEDDASVHPGGGG